MECLVERLQKGNIYCVGARPFVDKAQFCIGMASLFASKDNKVIYISHGMGEYVFTEKLNKARLNVGDNLEFVEMYKITIEGLEIFADDDDYDLIVLDPFDIYSLDIDIGDLKEFANKKNIAILLTVNIARPPLDSDRTHPILSDIKFLDKKTYKKLIAFSELIVFISQELNTNDFKILVGKDIKEESQI